MKNNDEARYAPWYLLGVLSFALPGGIQSVLLPHLLAIGLRQAPERYGVMQMLAQLPLLVLLLFGGLLADRLDPRRVLITLHCIAAIPAFALLLLLTRGEIGEAAVLAYAVSWGIVSAFAIPARDGMLNRVAGAGVQRMVTRAMAVQFAAQIVGLGVGGLADYEHGAEWVLFAQGCILLLGVFIAQRLPTSARVEQGKRADEIWWRALGGGLQLIFADAAMRAAFLLLTGVGLFFIGAFVVLMPLAVRDVYGGGASDISFGFVAFTLGTLVSMVALLQRGGVAYPGRALSIALYFGCLVLLPIALSPPQWGFYACMFLWGVGGGVAMTMVRTIMQERAPATHRARVLAAFSLATAGSAPLGSLLMGFAVSVAGVQLAVLLPAIGVAVATSIVLRTHAIWRVRSDLAR